MSSPITSASAPKVSKNPGLTIELKADTTGKLSPNLHSFTRPIPSAIDSLSNTPALEPDWIDVDDASDYDNNDGVQYLYISSESPFYRPPVTPRTSSYISVSGFPFACDALAEEDPLFAEPTADDELDSNSGDNVVMIADTDEDPDSQSHIEWKFTVTLDQAKPTRTETDNEALRPIF
ncbi:hypothetical protein C0995_002517 [Termitomyces sp. Mi166|nr:hypothetical protein C0995_002517 [Termitomyces sp. Mi166\